MEQQTTLVVIPRVYLAYSDKKPTMGRSVHIKDGEWELVGYEKVNIPRATVAAMIEGDTIKYGVSICSTTDRFDRKEGRKYAEKRMMEGYGTVELSKYCTDQLFTLKKGEELNHAKLKKFVVDLLNSVDEDIFKGALTQTTPKTILKLGKHKKKMNILG